MIYSNIPLAQTVVQLCKAKNIQHIVLSPGSRNAPLTIGFTNDDFFNCYSIVDERSAAFFALGIAQQINAPVALVCTSGSAVLNYYPAISEAFFSDIPLVILSADRPEYLINIGDGQTIFQDAIFGKHILYESHLKMDLSDTKEEILGKEKHELPWFLKGERLNDLQKDIQRNNEIEINKALNISRFKKGPVHLNIPFEEPLYETKEEINIYPEVIEFGDISKNCEIKSLESFIDIWNRTEKKMILVGVNPPNSLSTEILDKLAMDESVLVFTESTSNLYHPDFFPGIDKIIAPIELSLDSSELFEQLKPEILITFGGMLVSKKVKAFLRKYQPDHHWHIDEKKAYDTFFCLEHHIEMKPELFFNNILISTDNTSSKYFEFWNTIKLKRNQRHKEYLDQTDFSDLKVFQNILEGIPDNYQLQSGNSSTVRYIQLFDINPTLKVFCNRGTSGIDGSTSTAVGASQASTHPTLLITGDLSFFYDTNALWNNYIPASFRIIVINNSGGGIFRILPGDKENKHFDRFFETTHNLSAEHLCAMYNVDYTVVKNQEECNVALEQFFSPSEGPKLMEVFTPREKNDQILKEYFHYLK